ncbi:MAG: hypothetical protein ABIJ46_01660 [bacterium]
MGIFRRRKSHRHPHTFTLRLLELALDRLPPGFEESDRRAYVRRLRSFERDFRVPYEQIRLTVAQLGRDSWSQRRAYQEMYDRYGRSSEESYLIRNLDEGLREKYEKFILDGGKINYIEDRVRTERELLSPSPFETYFTPEEKFAVTQALLRARDSAREEINSLVTGKKGDEYRSLVAEYTRREAGIDRKIGELKRLAGLSRKWHDTIDDRVRVIEEGWSVIEPSMDEEKLDRELEYWHGTLASFLRT